MNHLFIQVVYHLISIEIIRKMSFQCHEESLNKFRCIGFWEVGRPGGCALPLFSQ
jgi:hypothetical protein